MTGRDGLVEGGHPARPYQNSEEFSFPCTIDAYPEKTITCHPWIGVAETMEPMFPETEFRIMKELLTSLNTAFKWNLDYCPVMTRELPALISTFANPSTVPALIIGRSNGYRLGRAFEDMGMNPVKLDFAGLSINKTTVDVFMPSLLKELGMLDRNIPVIIYALDNSCFRSITPRGDMLTLKSKQGERKFHVVGELAVTPFVLLSPVMEELERLIAACGTRTVYLISVLPRYVLNACCDEETHCTNVRSSDDAALEASYKLLDDLSDINRRMANRLSRRNVMWISAADLLSGKEECDNKDLMEALYACWANDPVHGDKMAYAKMAMGLSDILSGKSTSGAGARPTPAKRARMEDAPDQNQPQGQPTYIRGRYGDDNSTAGRAGDRRRDQLYPSRPGGTGRFGRRDVFYR
jgi:hypothetical protein